MRGSSRPDRVALTEVAILVWFPAHVSQPVCQVNR
jgi:hypothetical protein